MLRKIYIIHSSGICLYHLDFTNSALDKTPNDTQLLSGFFSALFQFGEGAIKADESATGYLNFICFKDLNYYFQKSKSLLIVIEIDQCAPMFNRYDAKEMIDFIIKLYEYGIQKGIYDENCTEYCHSPEFETLS